MAVFAIANWQLSEPTLAAQDEGESEVILTAQEAIEFYKESVKPILAEHCFECHGEDPEDLGGSLALMSAASIARGGDSGPAVDLQAPKKSLIWRAINYDDAYEMPPSGQLPQEQIDILQKWIKLGTPFDPAEEVDLTADLKSSVPQVNAETKQWWSFQPVAATEPPVVEQADWVRTPVDNFVLAKLESAGIKPAAQADRRTLARRVYYDLIGLPPSPEQMRAFVENQSPDAYEKLIDELLGSPHYGEKWGRHWLDLVRYAESNSFERDGTKPFVWRYRDYVIQAFNDDKPYNEFLIEQLAGDELAQPTAESLIATGYYRLGSWDDEPADPLLAKFDDLDSVLATTSQTMMGLTVDCARCHDHKIDPIPQADYYSLASFFENVRRYGVRGHESVLQASVATWQGEATAEEKQAHAEKLTELAEKMEAIVEKAKPGFEPVEHEDFQYEMNRVRILEKQVDNKISRDEFERYKRLSSRRKQLDENPPGSIKILAVKEHGGEPPTSFVRVRGNPHVTGDQVEPAFISVLSPPQPVIEQPANGKSLGRRLALAKWIASPDHPLTARVMANRIWQFHFGRGIVRSTSDFGFQGTPPTHPELLDWLAAEFVRGDWSIKKLHRTILLSNAYQMSGQFNPDAYAQDPENDLFWRFDLRRLTAEEIRDSILAVNDQLNLNKMFGPSIFPIMPPEVLAGQSVPGQNWGNSSDSDRNRRSIYIHIKRSLGLPILVTNDAADTDNPCPVRFITTQPTQALGMLNSEFTNRQAAKFAERISELHPAADDVRSRVATILQRVAQRQATEAEVDLGVTAIQAWEASGSNSDEALRYFCLLALNLNEFVYVD